MRMIKKAFALIAMAVSCMSAFAYNGGYENSLLTDTTIGGVTYKGYGNNTVTKRSESGATIAANAYAQCKALKSVDLAGVTSIGNAAFAYSALQSVTIPSSVASMGYIAFGGCTNLTHVTFASSSFWTKGPDLNKEPFRGCTKLTTVTVPGDVPSWSFKDVFTSVTKVECPSAYVSNWTKLGVQASPIVEKYTVRYNKNDGTSTVASQTINVGASEALLWKDSKLNWTNPAGKTFLGWATSATSGLAKYANGATVKDLAAAGKTIDLYAVWFDAKTDYVVKYYRNTSGSDTTVAQQCVKGGVSTALAWKVSGLGWSNPSGKTFLGWGTAANVAVAKYANGQSGVKDLAAAGKTVKLYAVWRPSNTYVVTFHRNLPGGDTTEASQWISRGVATTLAWKDSHLDWTPAGYNTFLGWAETASGEVKYSNGQKVTDLAAANVTKHLYAKWKGNTYTVRYHYNYGTTETTADQAFVYGTEQALKWVDSGLKWPHPLSAVFLGWATTADGDVVYANGKSVKNLTTANKGVVHLYAKWKLITVRFHKNVGGTDVTAMQYFKPDVAQRLLWKDFGLGWANPSGKLFVGWGLKANAAIANYANGESVKNLTSVGKTLDLYAVWAAADSYIVKFYRNYDSSDTTVAYQGVLRTVATRLAWKDSGLGWANPSGRMFLGWSKTRAATTKTYDNGQSVTGLGKTGATVALYAVWSTPKKSGEATSSSLQNEELATSIKSDVDVASPLGGLSWVPGYYCGTFADGSGVFDLLLDEFDAEGVAAAYFSATTEAGRRSDECEAMANGCDLWLQFEDRQVVIHLRDGGAVAE